MGLSIGIVGLPNVGKSTLFNALTKNDVLAANYPFATIEPNVGVVAVPDPRLAILAEIFGSERQLPAVVNFVDIAGIVKGASEGEGLGNQFLASIRESDAICEVVRAFEDDDVIHVDGKVDPSSDVATIETELILADLQTVEKALTRLERDAKRGGAGDAAVRLAAVQKTHEILNSGRVVSSAGKELDRAAIADLHLLTDKPFIYVFNVDEDTLSNEARRNELIASVGPAPAIVLCAKLEAELSTLSDEEAAELLSSFGQDESGLAQLSRVGFDTLGLQTYLTAGPKEARAWTIHKGDTAPVAAGVIHTDFQKHFIKAEVVAFADLVEAGSVVNARSVGKARIEGKDYIMQDGDVVEFRIGQ
jgi:GTP-binding protein YchF